MPAHKHTMLQICIICVLCYVLGLRLVWQYPEFFNGAGHNSTDRFITLGRRGKRRGRTMKAIAIRTDISRSWRLVCLISMAYLNKYSSLFKF
jgi:hypothetical protein